MIEETRAIRSVCVAGAGIVGLSAALAFARALPHLTISIVATPPDPAALADRLPGTLPSVHRFHAAIGFDELDLVRAGIATHLLGTLFEHWSASDRPWVHAHGDYGIPAGEASFLGVWRKVGGDGDARPYHLHAAAAVLAEAGKFVHPSDDPQSPFSAFLYGLRLDPDRYRARLLAACAPLTPTPGVIAGIERRGDGGVAALRLEGGERIEADLFLDCTGPAAHVLSALDDGFEDWSAWLPCDRLTITEAASGEQSSCDTVTATAQGWSLHAPLADRIMTAHLSAAGGHDARDTICLRAGWRPRPWVHNVLALGDAAVAVDPLHSTNLHLAHSAILRALELLPGRECHPLELAEYNRRAGQEAARVRDFLALHYLRSGRSDPPFWAAVAGRAAPPTLARTIEQFTRRGRLPFFEEESFDKHSWSAALIGLGVVPDHVDPVADGVDAARAAAAMARLAERIAALVARVPPYGEMLAQMKAAPARPRR